MVPIFFFAYLFNRHLQGDTTTGTGHHVEGHKHHHSHETGGKPFTERVKEGVHKVTDKVMHPVSWLSPSVHSVLNICFEYQGWRRLGDRREELLSRLFPCQEKKKITYCTYTFLLFICMATFDFPPLPFSISKNKHHESFLGQ
jgi:hypothetical protein